jgi:hypothetical protein
LAEEKSKHAGLAQQNSSWSSIFPQAAEALAKGTTKR